MNLNFVPPTPIISASDTENHKQMYIIHFNNSYCHIPELYILLYAWNKKLLSKYDILEALEGIYQQNDE